jgi:response regulator RpfG family c-di-GMP phosphodiesterase
MATRQNSPTNGAENNCSSCESAVDALLPTHVEANFPKLSPASGQKAGGLSNVGVHSPLRTWLAQALISPEAWIALPAAQQQLLGRAPFEQLIEGLQRKGLLTRYQAERIRAGNTQNLVIGNYRILSKLGVGGMGIVYKAEQIKLRRPVALKVLRGSSAPSFRMLDRFWAESRAVAQLEHPNIVTAIDAGETQGTESEEPTPYFVMEYLEGRDLDNLVTAQGPLDIVRAVQIMSQMAGALCEAHRQKLIHRDIKPSNIFITAKGQSKLLDFGLALQQQHSQRLTVAGMMLGTMGYMAPEQARDPRSVDERADLFSLGCVLYWCLTGEHPYDEESGGPFCSAVFSSRAFRKRCPNAPRELEEVIRRLMAERREDRYPDALSVYRALLGFLPEYRKIESIPADSGRRSVLVVDDSPAVRFLSVQALQRSGYECIEAGDAGAAIEQVQQKSFDLVLLDDQLPDMETGKVLQRLRESNPSRSMNVIVMSGNRDPGNLAALRLQGADDCIAKPFTSIGLLTIARTNLEATDKQMRSLREFQTLADENSRLRSDLDRTRTELVRTRDFLVQSIAELIGGRTEVSGLRALRLQRYTRSLSAEAALSSPHKEEITTDFRNLLELWIPLLDVGLLLLPDAFLVKAGDLEPHEQELMKSHATLGADLLSRIAARQTARMSCFQMAITIARYHHERFDGKGYPDKLTGNEIPLPARFAAIADVYDSLRCRRAFRPSMTHVQAVQTMADSCAGQFDPHLFEAFLRCQDQFNQIFEELPE